MEHTENTRVKIPALIHLTRLGYKYFSLKSLKNEDDKFNVAKIDLETNILKDVFQAQFLKINKMSAESKDDLRTFQSEFQNISLELDYNDLGKTFYNRLIGKGNSTYKLIDWENFKNNVFQVCTELTYRSGEDEFRPDITVFINGLPLAFIEVKIPNNPEGIKTEKDRINDRCKNEKFRKFINISQLLVFSNNMMYDDTGIDQLQGAFYATTSKNKVKFNNFREELESDYIDELNKNPIKDEIENEILRDTNYEVIKFSPEFISNKNEKTPTNSILSSLFSKNRLKMMLQYGIAYVNGKDEEGKEEIQKHIMRYPQFFATKAIRSELENGIKKGVIWHTQGSGKTALAFYCVRYLTDYFSKKGIVPKFYFVVDRLDLLKQSRDEFKKRGLEVNLVKSREELKEDFAKNTGEEGITLINIQKFNDDTRAFDDSGYDIKIQRIYFIDEAHRSYDPHGSFLANLYKSDEKSIKIALTGTPLIIYKDHKKEGEEEDLTNKENYKTTRNIFGNYIHKYYYNNSIKDGCTLKLLREEIETTYKEKLRQIREELQEIFKKGALQKRDLYSHKKFVEPMIKYIVEDFKFSKIRFGNETIGAMVVCDSSEQAREMFKQFKEKYTDLKGALILHNEDDKDTRENERKDFREGKIDFLFVYSMLLTGFDAPRLKKLYLGRKIKAHNLLQTLTRVNRPYGDFRVGYVVDFADISNEFDITNKAYFDELNREYDTDSTGENGFDVFGSLFMSKEEIDEKIENMKNILSDYDTENLENFQNEITALSLADINKLKEMKKVLEDIKEIYNVAKLLGHTEALEKIDPKNISRLYREAENRLNLINLQNSIGKGVNSKQLLNVAIENVIFDFTKIGEEELKMLANDTLDKAYNVRNAIRENWNQEDQEWISIYEEWLTLLKKCGIDENNLESKKDYEFANKELTSIYNKIRELNRKNSVLKDKFSGDKKFARIFKRLVPSGKVSDNIGFFEVLKYIKNKLSEKVNKNKGILENEGYFRKSIYPIISESKFEKNISLEIKEKIRDYVADEYLKEYRGT